MKSARARALANLALVKYFGKRDLRLNLPAAGSLSLTLEPLSTTTEVVFDPALDRDVVILQGEHVQGGFASRVSAFLDLIRQMSDTRDHATVTTDNSFPTAAGLASSASGFGALALAGTAAVGLKLAPEKLSALARRGSGSAARSISGGICVWYAGEEPNGDDSYAASICEPESWDLRVVVGVSNPGKKSIGSTESMELTRVTSPYYDNWISTVKSDLSEAIWAVERRDFAMLGEIAERNALSMHAAALAARPGILFWNGTTVEAIHLTRKLRSDGRQVYFTCDAGPQPKILCTPGDVADVSEALKTLPGITRIIPCRLGRGAELV